jgi:hypothetical protein
MKSNRRPEGRAWFSVNDNAPSDHRVLQCRADYEWLLMDWRNLAMITATGTSGCAATARRCFA